MSWDRDRLGETILLCLAGVRKSPLRAAGVVKSLEGLFGVSEADRSTFARNVLDALDHVTESGFVRSEKKDLYLTEAGQARCRDLFGIGFPCRTGWQQLKNRALARALAPNIPVPIVAKRVKDGWRGVDAMVINQAERVSEAPAPTLNQVRDALAWRELGGDPRQKPTFPGMVTLLLSRALGAPAGMSQDMLLKTWAAKSVGASSSQPEAVRTAAMRRWAASGRAGSDFVTRVVAAARRPETQKFGEQKAFLASVFDTYRSLLTNEQLDWPEFGRRLVAAHVDGHICLARADLVTAMDSSLVERSELRHETETFHFIDLAASA